MPSQAKVLTTWSACWIVGWRRCGGGAQAKCIVIDPEVDSWLWGADSVLRDELRWPLAGKVRSWLQAQGFVFDAHGKPDRPKDAIEALVRYCRLPRSSALYEKITARISLMPM